MQSKPAKKTGIIIDSLTSPCNICSQPARDFYLPNGNPPKYCVRCLADEVEHLKQSQEKNWGIADEALMASIEDRVLRLCGPDGLARFKSVPEINSP